MANVNGDEFSALWAAIAELRAELQDVREVQRDHTGTLLSLSARLDQHGEFHRAHAAGFTMLSDRLDEHGALLQEILRRLDAA